LKKTDKLRALKSECVAICGSMDLQAMKLSPYLEVDETTDSRGRYIANLLIGSLCGENSSESYLISTKLLERTNNATVARFIHEELTNVFLHLLITLYSCCQMLHLIFFSHI
jgi:hypothetical protein